MKFNLMFWRNKRSKTNETRYSYYDEFLREPEEEPNFDMLNYNEKNCLVSFYKAFDEDMNTYTFYYRKHIWFAYQDKDGSREYFDCGNTLYNVCARILVLSEDEIKEENFYRILRTKKTEEELDSAIEEIKAKAKKAKQLSIRRK